MKKSNFVMSVQFTNGNVSEMFNCCGLKEATLEAAIHDGNEIFTRRYNENISSNSDLVVNNWAQARPHSIRYDVLDENGFYSYRETFTF